MPCYDGYRDGDRDDEEYGDDEYDAEEEINDLLQDIGVGPLLQAIACRDDFEPLRLPKEFTQALRPYVENLLEERGIQSVGHAASAANAACDALKIIEEFGLSSEVRKETLRWWGDHKDYDTKRKAVIMKKVSDIRARRKLNIKKRKSGD